MSLSAGTLAVRYVRHPRARRYRLLFHRDGSARCTIPRRGTLAEGRRFVASQETWLAARLRQHLARPSVQSNLRAGGLVWLGGVEMALEVESSPGAEQLLARLGDLRFVLPSIEGDLRPAVEAALRRSATKTLKARAQELAAANGLTSKVRGISIRNQSTRWGSCSPRGLICLNWRLIQLPPSVSDYVILHELAHLQHLNHSPRFWAEVARLCPSYADAEAWLKRSGRSVL
ncbi:MAG TPA: SprT family zinc-dependent metalloprotease [Verrucomicrobiota bacterium]|nr:SprT family zinc-dependent metalloprotease [Verrucomicrobiota bacterium]